MAISEGRKVSDNRWTMKELSGQFVIAAKGRQPNVKIVYGSNAVNAPLYGTKDEARATAIIIQYALNGTVLAHPKDVRGWKADSKMGFWLAAALDDPQVCREMKADIQEWFEAHQTTGAISESELQERAREALEAAIRAAKLALFVIRKQDVMPNSSWEAGFNSDLKTAEDALAALAVSAANPPLDNTWDQPLDNTRGRMR